MENQSGSSRHTFPNTDSEPGWGRWREKRRPVVFFVVPSVLSGCEYKSGQQAEGQFWDHLIICWGSLLLQELINPKAMNVSTDPSPWRLGLYKIVVIHPMWNPNLGYKIVIPLKPGHIPEFWLYRVGIFVVNDKSLHSPEIYPFTIPFNHNHIQSPFLMVKSC